MAHVRWRILTTVSLAATLHALLADRAAAQQDTALSVHLTGRLQVDVGAHRGDGAPGAGTVLRRGRIGFEAARGPWEAEFEVDAAESPVEVKDAFVAWHRGLARVQAGQFKEPFSLEATTSSADVVLLERSLIDALAPDRALGLSVAAHGSAWHLAAGTFADAIGTERPSGRGASGAAAARLLVMPAWDRGHLHLGLAASRRRLPRGGARDVDVEAETAIGEWLVASATVDSARTLARWNGELLVSSGRTALHAEFTSAAWSSASGGVTMRGGYLMLTHFLTPDRRTFDRAAGEFEEVRPTGASGAWELAARISAIDVAHVPGGGIAGTVGVSWFADAHLRVMANAMHARRQSGPGDDGVPKGALTTLQARVSVSF